MTATAASAPTDPASPANTPKWCVHLVGVNIIARNEMMVIPMMRRLGPAAVPVMWPRRSIIATDTASATIRASTAKRRAIEPSGVAIISRSYRVCSSNQLRLGPTARLSAVAWATAAKVWSRNIRMIGTVAAAAIGASSGSNPNCRERRPTIVRSGPIATSRAPIEAIPVGPENSVRAPRMQAIATGSSRLVATPRSTEHQVARIPSAMIGSGRRPLFSGSQKARNRPAAVQTAARLCLTAAPSRGITSRLISHQHASAISSVGSRIQMLAVDTCAHIASRS